MAKHSSPDGTLQRFLETRDMSLLEDPVVMQKNEGFTSYMCCCGFAGCCASMGISAFFCPIGTFCPGSMYKDFNLQLDRTSVKLSTASNDCCCHIAKNQTTAPLDKIQDVALDENWIQTMFGLKQVNVQTAGGAQLEMAVPFLAYPEKVRDAIQLAVKLHKEGAAMAPSPQLAMQRGGGGALKLRLDGLAALVSRGTLTQQEADGMRVAVLSSVSDPLPRLTEAANLVDTNLISSVEFAQIKRAILAQITDRA